jgi:hypothetical protein
MKKLLISMTLLFITLVSFAIPNEKVLESFSNSFPKADSVSWYENGSNFEVHFNMGDVRCKLWYDENGIMIKSHRYYKGNMLPPMILASLQRKYSDKNIHGVTEVTSNEGVQYFIILDDDKKWYDVTSDASGNLTLTKKFNKA